MQVVSSLKEPGPAPAGATPPAGVRRVGIEALPALALRVLRAALQPLPACMADDTELFIRYVHRKPERRLTVICAAGAPRERAAPGSARSTGSFAPGCPYSARCTAIRKERVQSPRRRSNSMPRTVTMDLTRSSPVRSAWQKRLGSP